MVPECARDAEAAARLKLFNAARDDVGSSGLRISQISDSYAKAPEPKEFVILEGSAHAQSLFDTTPESDPCGSLPFDHIIDFLSHVRYI